MESITDLWNSVVASFPDIVLSILYLVLAFVVALIAKKIVMGILHKVGAEKVLAKSGVKDEKSGKSTEFIGKLTFLVVFLLFLPAVLSRLGMENVASPITSMISDIVGFLPNLLAAGIILYIGIYLAQVIRQLVKALLHRLGLDRLQKKLGVEAVKDQDTFAGVLAGVVYVLILIPVIIAALQILNIEAIAGPAMTILSQVFSYVPVIFVAILLLVIGYQLAKILAPVVKSLLSSIGADKLSEKIGHVTGAKVTPVSISTIVSEIVRWLIIIVFFIEAVNLLNLAVLATIGGAVLAYLPFVISAAIIMGGGIIIALWMERVIVKHSQKSFALVVKVAIIILAAFMALSQLGFAQSIVNIAFIVLLTGMAVAFAIAFGIGGKTFAANRLAELEQNLESKDE